MKTNLRNIDFTTAIKALAMIVLALSAATVGAETVYKYQRADGKVVYSDVPLRGAKLIGRFELVPLPPPQPAGAAAPRAQAPAGGGPDERARRRVESLDATDAEIKAADQALKDAQERQRAGEEPLPGERIGVLSPGDRRHSRLSPEYFERQRKLAANVESARARLEQAYKKRDELRD